MTVLHRFVDLFIADARTKVGMRVHEELPHWIEEGQDQNNVEKYCPQSKSNSFCLNIYQLLLVLLILNLSIF